MTVGVRNGRSTGPLGRTAVSVAWLLLIGNVALVAGASRVLARTLQRGYEAVLHMPQPLPRIMGRVFSDAEYDLLVCAGPLARAHTASR